MCQAERQHKTAYTGICTHVLEEQGIQQLGSASNDKDSKSKWPHSTVVLFYIFKM